MNKTLIVLRHEFLQKVRSRTFIIMTAIGPLLMGAIIVIPAYFASTNTGEVRNLVVIDSTGRLAQAMIAASNEDAGKFFTKKISTKVTLESVQPGPNVTDSLGKLVESKALTGYMTIPANAIADSASTAQIKLHNPSDYTAVAFLKDSYRDAVRDAKLTSRGIDPKAVSNVESGVHVETMKIEAGKEKKDSGDTGVVMAFVTAFILYISMILYGTIIMNSVIEEKSSRVIELIASSVRPFQLLVGKVLGVASAGLIQIGVWAIMLVALTTVGLTAASAMLGQDVMPSISPFLFLYLILFFVLGFLIYATLYAAIGSTAESASDVQQVSFPVVMLLVIPFIMLQGVIQSPSSTKSVVLSLVPFFSPILMLARIFTETPPWWQIALSVALMIGTFFGCLWLAARIYRVGILMYGKKFKLSEIAKWVRYT
ncbi:MAG: ABC transporter permease [Bacteroidota bacterium]|nr:ABC transporter permease [Bacteroidota bacterium]MDP4233374.1 ABC transporter permease [Bacteroidota bacterium]MDP4242240.1 ABC transporter permease [Bacteroidota bacterium]MDP4286996.1 ABC transporter permease [Bacteroidota bacterium]